MYTLKAVAEIHPDNTLLNILEDESTFDRGFAYDFLLQIMYAYKANPALMASEKYWLSRYKKLAKIVDKEAAAYLKGGILCTLVENKKILMRRGVEEIWRTYAGEFAEMDKSRVVYHEGYDHHPLKEYAQSRGVAFVDLDNADSLSLPDNLKGQRRRESLWIEKIEPSPEIDQSLLVAGAKHVENAFGLADRLREKDIRLQVVMDCSVLDDEARRKFPSPFQNTHRM